MRATPPPALLQTPLPTSCHLGSALSATPPRGRGMRKVLKRKGGGQPTGLKGSPRCGATARSLQVRMRKYLSLPRPVRLAQARVLGTTHPRTRQAPLCTRGQVGTRHRQTSPGPNEDKPADDVSGTSRTQKNILRGDGVRTYKRPLTPSPSPAPAPSANPRGPRRRRALGGAASRL